MILAALLLPTLIFAQDDPKKEYKSIGDDAVFSIVEEMPEYSGGQQALFTYLGKNLSYPESAIDAGISGTVYVQFVVDTDGSIKDANVVRGIGEACDDEALRVVNSMPTWKPGKQRGKNVKVSYILPVKFSLGNDGPKPPVYPNGSSAMHEYVKKNFVYPKKLIKNGCPSGILIMQVGWDATGKIIKVEGVESDLLNKEMIRVIESMPTFRPAIDKGTEVPHAGTLSFPYFCPDKD